MGKVPGSVQVGSNADLMATVAPLYLTGSVLDVTYGRGKWWDRFTPDPFTYHDLALDGVDFRHLPHVDAEFDAVTFDPPYIAAGGEATSDDAAKFRSAFGLTAGRNAADLDALVLDGLTEVCRVSRRWLLVKCMEFVGSRLFRDMPTDVTNACRGLGFVKHDQIVHHTGSGPGGHNITTIKRTRRHHSYLLVFIREGDAF